MFSLIVELAEYERAADQVVGTEEMLAAALFGPEPVAEALIAEVGAEPAGFALFYTSFSTWQCAPGIWLEDLVVRERFRGAGVGGALMRELAALALQRGCGTTGMGGARLERVGHRLLRPPRSELGRLSGDCAASMATRCERAARVGAPRR